MGKVKPCCNFNLQMLNLWIGMCRGVTGLPRDFTKKGYADKWIEHRFTNAEREEVVPELIIASSNAGHTLLFEWKSGGNLDSDQLRRYSKVTAEDLTEKAFLDQAAVERHDVAVVGKSDYADRLKTGIKQDNYAFPLLVVDEQGLKLVHNKFALDELTQIFSPLLSVDLAKAPTGFVPFDENSELWEVAECVIPMIIEYMSRRETRLLLDKLAGDAVPTWDIMGGRHRKSLRAKIFDVVEQAAKTHFRKYLRRNKAAEGRTKTKTWEIVSNPLDLQSDKRTREYRALLKGQKEFIQALAGKKEAVIQTELDLGL